MTVRTGDRFGTAESRFLAKVEKGPSCWRWTGALNSCSYGVFGAGGRNNLVLAHRWSYERYVGPIPAGLTIDHLCFNRWCVAPLHLDPCSHAENNRRRGVHQRRRKIESALGPLFAPPQSTGQAVHP